MTKRGAQRAVFFSTFARGNLHSNLGAGSSVRFNAVGFQKTSVFMSNSQRVR